MQRNVSNQDVLLTSDNEDIISQNKMPKKKRQKINEQDNKDTSDADILNEKILDENILDENTAKDLKNLDYSDQEYGVTNFILDQYNQWKLFKNSISNLSTENSSEDNMSERKTAPILGENISILKSSDESMQSTSSGKHKSNKNRQKKFVCKKSTKKTKMVPTYSNCTFHVTAHPGSTFYFNTTPQTTTLSDVNKNSTKTNDENHITNMTPPYDNEYSSMSENEINETEVDKNPVNEKIKILSNDNDKNCTYKNENQDTELLNIHLKSDESKICKPIFKSKIPTSAEKLNFDKNYNANDDSIHSTQYSQIENSDDVYSENEFQDKESFSRKLLSQVYKPFKSHIEFNVSRFVQFNGADFISQDDLNKINDSLSLGKNREYFVKTDIYIPIFRGIIEKYNEICVWGSQGCKYRKTKTAYKALFYCRHDGCNLKAEVNLNIYNMNNAFIEFFMNSKNNPLNNSESITIVHKMGHTKAPVIRQRERKTYYSDAITKSARGIWADDKSKLNMNQILGGKTTISLSTARKLKKEAYASEFHDKDLENALYILSTVPKQNTFIKKWISAPETQIICTHNQNLQLGLMIGKQYAVHCDAIGKIAKNYKEKKMLYYELVCLNPVEHQPTFPLIGFFSTGQSEDDIQILFATLQELAKQINGTPDWNPRKFMCDKSLAILKPAILIFNKESLSSYLNWVYKFLEGKECIKGRTLFTLCYFHHMKNLKDNLNKKEPQCTSKGFILAAASTVSASTTLIEYHDRLENFMIVCLSQYQHTAYKKARKSLTECIKDNKNASSYTNVDVPYVTEQLDKEDNDIDSVITSNLSLKESPFYIKALEIKKKVDEILMDYDIKKDKDINKEPRNNPFYTPSFIKYVIENPCKIPLHTMKLADPLDRHSLIKKDGKYFKAANSESTNKFSFKNLRNVNNCDRTNNPSESRNHVLRLLIKDPKRLDVCLKSLSVDYKAVLNTTLEKLFQADYFKDEKNPFARLYTKERKEKEMWGPKKSSQHKMYSDNIDNADEFKDLHDDLDAKNFENTNFDLFKTQDHYNKNENIGNSEDITESYYMHLLPDLDTQDSNDAITTTEENISETGYSEKSKKEENIIIKSSLNIPGNSVKTKKEKKMITKRITEGPIRLDISANMIPFRNNAQSCYIISSINFLSGLGLVIEQIEHDLSHENIIDNEENCWTAVTRLFKNMLEIYFKTPINEPLPIWEDDITIIQSYYATDTIGNEDLNVFSQRTALSFLESFLKFTNYQVLIKAELKCTNYNCMHCKNEFEPYTFLQIYIAGKQNIQEAIDSFTDYEVIQEAKCEKCSQKGFSLKRAFIDAPNVLFISINRPIVTNINATVFEIVNQMKIGIDIDEKILIYSNDEPISYKLHAGISFIGSDEHGHYVCFAHLNSNFVIFDDDKFIYCKKNDPIITSHCKFLVYEKQMNFKLLNCIQSVQQKCEYFKKSVNMSPLKVKLLKHTNYLSILKKITLSEDLIELVDLFQKKLDLYNSTYICIDYKFFCDLCVKTVIGDLPLNINESEIIFSNLPSDEILKDLCQKVIQISNNKNFCKHIKSEPCGEIRFSHIPKYIFAVGTRTNIISGLVILNNYIETLSKNKQLLYGSSVEFDTVFVKNKPYTFINEHFLSYEKNKHQLSKTNEEYTKQNKCLYILKCIQNKQFRIGIEDMELKDYTLDKLSQSVYISGDKIVHFSYNNLVNRLKKTIICKHDIWPEYVKQLETLGSLVFGSIIDGYYKTIQSTIQGVKFSTLSINLSNMILEENSHIPNKIFHNSPVSSHKKTIFEEKEDILFVPLHLSESAEHYVFFIISWWNKTIILYDPLGQFRENFKNRVWKFVSILALRRSISTENWLFLDAGKVKNCPLQKDSTSCGLFCMIVGTSIITGMSLSKYVFKENETRQFISNILSKYM